MAMRRFGFHLSIEIPTFSASTNVKEIAVSIFVVFLNSAG